MKNLKNLCLFILLFSFSFNGMYAQQQQKTAYEKKKDAIIVQLGSKYGQRMTQLIVNTAESKGDKEFIAYVASLKDSGAKELAALYGRNTPEIDAMSWYANQLKLAEKLKTAVDLKREKDAAYAKTDAGHIRGDIKDAFEKWNQKSEFEKESDYAERLKTQSQTVFEEICIKQIKSKVNNYNNLKKEPSTYNSESELFTVVFKINDIEWQSTINIPIDKAENFKNNLPDFKSEIDNYDWCFIESSLYPTLVTLDDREEKVRYEFPLSLKNQSEISYPFDDLEIDNPYLKDYVFKYSNAKIIDRQIYATYHARLDSIFNDYNRQLLQNPFNVAGKTITDFEKMKTEGNREENFNQSVSSIKSNFDRLNDNFKRELERENPTEYCKIYYTQNPDKKTEAEKMYLECRCKYSKREDFDLKFIKGNLYDCNCRETEYRKNGNLFTSKDEFDNLYDKGDDVYLPETEKRTILNYLTVNSKFIESMDFQKEKTESVGSALGRGLLGAATNTNVSAKAYTDENKARKDILSVINDSKNKQYYSQVIDLVIETNKGFNKEWSKSGQYFESKAEFYDVYVSGNYKQVLKDKKKKK